MSDFQFDDEFAIAGYEESVEGAKPKLIPNGPYQFEFARWNTNQTGEGRTQIVFHNLAQNLPTEGGPYERDISEFVYPGSPQMTRILLAYGATWDGPLSKEQLASFLDSLKGRFFEADVYTSPAGKSPKTGKDYPARNRISWPRIS